MAAQRVLLSIKRSTLPLTETLSAPHDDHVGRTNLSGMPLMYNVWGTRGLLLKNDLGIVVEK
ncbi:hypothetical protein GIB67_030788 [Kingdonia uniflora]|uniref:Uncharacterized protein n=1 Tax=Kingdonia uniflora TaxID=39325 RepID=A0A7J7L387_9MAGN|nr:hypothetical protein GIB67_030788 [Kingdonia uniflora]